jgi:V/A-type H+/Na+-transporting ATPase subunit A
MFFEKGSGKNFLKSFSRIRKRLEEGMAKKQDTQEKHEKLEKQGTIIKVAGPLVVARGIPNATMYDVVKVSDKNLIGEIIEIHGEDEYIQVYEDTSGLGPGEPVVSTYKPLVVELGPGIIESIYDGIQRPLAAIRAESGDFIHRGIDVPGLSREKKWEFKPTRKVGDKVSAGCILGTVDETVLVQHKIMVPPDIKEGTIKMIEPATKTVEEVICILDTPQGERKVTMMQKWPVRIPRPIKTRIAPDKPLITGQRVIDTFFPIAKGGTACVPGPFGSGKTVVQHQLAKWADSEIVIFVGCGERGNEMTDVLKEFPELKDPKSGEPLMKRTVLIANTSNMPVAAREASVYTGITIAEYLRDMGYSVAIMGDSTSRWAEALREMSGRLEEMPGEEGYPAYLGTRIASFYERAGRVVCQGDDDREGALSVIGAVSPPGGDLSEPVTQNTLRVVKVFWGLTYELAHARHFPAISWLTSYSLYTDIADEYLAEEVAMDWPELRKLAMRVLQQEAELEEIVRLVGIEALSKRERLIMETAKSIREDFLMQNAFDPDDTYSSMQKQYKLLKTVLAFYYEGEKAIKKGLEIDKLIDIPVREKIGRAKFIPEKELERLDNLERELKEEINALIENIHETVEA